MTAPATYYSREITEPANRREGIGNHLQMIINRLEAGDSREAMLQAVDLLDAIRSSPDDKTFTIAAGGKRRRGKKTA